MNTFDQFKIFIQSRPKYSNILCTKSDIDSSQRWDTVVCLSGGDLDKPFTELIDSFRPGMYWKIGPNLDHIKVCIPRRKPRKNKHKHGKPTRYSDDPKYWLPLLYLLGISGLTGFGAIVTNRQDWSFLF